MKVTFLALGCEQLSVSLLSAIARRDGHEVGLAFSAALFDDRYQLSFPRLAKLFDDRATVIDAIRDQQPDVLACSVLTNNYVWMLDIAREAKQLLPGLKTVFGGVHPSAVPDVVLARDEVDFVCVGEGDVAFPALLRELESGGPRGPIPNMRYRNEQGNVVRGPQAPFIQNLDELPYFDKQIWEEHIRIGDFYIAIASRGCPYRCTFCFNSFFAQLPDGKPGKYVRQRSVDHMMGELIAAKRRYKLRFIDFEDDIFTVNKGWLEKFLHRYKREIGIPFQCLTHPKYVDDDVAGWLADAGCQWAQMGVQSADDEYKNQALKRYEGNDHVERAVDALLDHRIKLKVDHIFGLPGEPMQAQETARQLYSARPPARVDTFWATYFPGTVMVEQAREQGLLSDAEISEIDHGHVKMYHSDGHVAPERLATYRAYEVLFRALPMLPRFVRDRVSHEPLEKLPPGAARAAALGVDLVNAARTLSYEHVAYGVHYLQSMARHVVRRLGWRPPPATRPHGPPMCGPRAPRARASALLSGDKPRLASIA